MWGITLNRQCEMPLKRQLYNALRSLILDGKLRGDEALPSTRELAKNLGVSRNTVCEAYDMLIVEGFIKNRQGAATKVVEGLYVEKMSDSPTLEHEISTPTVLADFRTGQPDMRLFPRYAWQQMLHRVSEEIPLHQLGYTSPQGLSLLRDEISGWLFRNRGLSVDPMDIFITSGATHGLHMIGNLLYKDGQNILIEDPCHMGMLHTFINKGFHIIPVPVDVQGIQIEYLNCKNTAAIYVTPSHQFPLGGILPAERRASLIRYAREKGIYIVEDDYDSEFRYSGQPIAPLFAMDPQHVIYVGTFSKILFPALRIGYVILPRQLHKRWCELRIHTDVQNPTFEQSALAEFLHTRKLDRHVQKMRRIYGERRLILLETLKEEFGEVWNLWGDAAGLHLVLEFSGINFDNEFIINSNKNGIRINVVENYCIRKGFHLDKLLLGYGHLEPGEIKQNVLLLHDFMERCLII